MSIPAPQTTDYRRANTARVRKHKDGSVLLSISQDRICKLNGVGALTWMILEKCTSGLTVGDVVAALQTQFDAVNAEGEIVYEVSLERLRADTARFLQNLVNMNLLHVSRNFDGRECYSIKDDVTGTTSAIASTVEDSEHSAPAEQGEADLECSKRETFSAFLALLAFDLLLKIAGFQSLIKKVESWPTTKPSTTNREICRHVRAVVDRAQMYYPKKAMCLQHSAVVTCLLRRRGVPAEMVLAAQEFPPKAHAWAEVAGEVVNDRNAVKQEYLVLRRL